MTGTPDWWNGPVPDGTGKNGDLRSFDAAESVPMPYRRATQVIGGRSERDALAGATDDPGEVTVCGIATRNEGIGYDWDSVPSFVGVDGWSGRNERFLSPDAVTGVYERLGLPALPRPRRNDRLYTLISLDSNTKRGFHSQRGVMARLRGC